MFLARPATHFPGKTFIIFLLQSRTITRNIVYEFSIYCPTSVLYFLDHSEVDVNRTKVYATDRKMKLQCYFKHGPTHFDFVLGMGYLLYLNIILNFE
jgi:hypothetical protein